MKTMLRHVYAIYVRATPEAIWRAITTGELSRQYFWGCAVESDWKAGASLRYFEGDELIIDGEVVEIDPPRKLVHTFSDRNEGTENDPASRVTWEIEPLGEECRVTLIHDGFESATKTFTSVENGWPPILSGLKTLVETGNPLAIAWPEGEDIRRKPEHSGPTQIHQIYVKASLERVWEAITQDEHMSDFFPGRIIVDEWKPGATYRVYDEDEDKFPFEGTILEFDRPRRLSYTFKNRWMDEANNERPSRVTYELTPMGDTCRVVVIHDDFQAESQTFAAVQDGWPSILSHMKSYLETGRTLAA